MIVFTSFISIEKLQKEQQIEKLNFKFYKTGNSEDLGGCHITIIKIKVHSLLRFQLIDTFIKILQKETLLKYIKKFIATHNKKNYKKTNGIKNYLLFFPTLEETSYKTNITPYELEAQIDLGLLIQYTKEKKHLFIALKLANYQYFYLPFDYEITNENDLCQYIKTLKIMRNKNHKLTNYMVNFFNERFYGPKETNSTFTKIYTLQKRKELYGFEIVYDEQKK